MRILLTFENFVGFAGTETYTLTVAKELERLGHDALIYSPNRGPMAEHARRQGVRVVGADELPPDRELVIFSDAATCHELAGRYAHAVRIFVAHSTDFMLTAPPGLPDLFAAIVVLNDRVRRAVEARAWHPAVVRLRQPIPLLRLRNLGPPRSPPRVALVVSNYLRGPRAALIEQGSGDLEVRWIGATSTPTTAPELALADADMVIGLGRGVLEAMAAGRAAYVYGVAGGDGWVTPERYPAMEADGFGGTADPDVVIDAARLAAALAEWDPLMGEVNRDLASAHHSARDHAIALVELARTLEPGPPAPLAPGEELARLIRLEMHNLERVWAGLDEITGLRAAVAERDREAAALRERLESLLRTRRYRLASRLAAPLDRLRGR